MTKARMENGMVRLYNKLPSRYNSQTLNVAGEFEKLPNNIHQQEGFYEVIQPYFDPDSQILGDIYFDEGQKVFTYPVIDIEIDIEQIRNEKLKEFERILEIEMTPALMFGVIEKLAMGEPIPPEMKNTITALRTREAEVKGLIESITDPKQMLKFRFNSTEIEQSKEILKSGRKL